MALHENTLFWKGDYSSDFAGQRSQRQSIATDGSGVSGSRCMRSGDRQQVTNRSSQWSVRA